MGALFRWGGGISPSHPFRNNPALKQALKTAPNPLPLRATTKARSSPYKAYPNSKGLAVGLVNAVAQCIAKGPEGTSWT